MFSNQSYDRQNIQGFVANFYNFLSELNNNKNNNMVNKVPLLAGAIQNHCKRFK